ncbi:DUF4439 domain-containing protein [Pseudarthrobacter sp. W1I19]|uniref:DUF4439 domain-containing protein n=1 Tax=Pseudarthrobacter sp. W1I19 TaxID=3042288 RepID=UPI0027D7B15C|nr:DUF4439 domain-containing protein [Pseudarthrobacter sp. W1I19]
MKDDNQENRPRMRYFRYAVFSLAALLVVTLGFAFFPAEPPAPAEPPFSEQARAAALYEALELRSAALELAAADPGSTAGAPAEESMTQVVTLLTIQARALLLPGSQASAEAFGPTSAPASTAGVPPAAAPPSPSPRAAASVAEFAARLAASGLQRLNDAETADGGMARLLAGAGTAQLLTAERLGAAASLETEARETERQGATAPACPAMSSAPDSASTSPPAGMASLGAALAAAAGAELETAYGYQAALTRLPPEAVRPASEFLAQHQDLAGQAEEYGRTHCGTLPPQPPGYVLDQGFLDSPAAGLAGLEADTLPLYGDVVALAEGATRAWALAGLQDAARRAHYWGAGAGPVPGLVLDEGQLPPLPQ